MATDRIERYLCRSATVHHARVYISIYMYVPTTVGISETERCSLWPRDWATGTYPCGSSSRGSSVSLVCKVRLAYRSWPSLVLMVWKHFPPRSARHCWRGRYLGRRHCCRHHRHHRHHDRRRFETDVFFPEHHGAGPPQVV